MSPKKAARLKELVREMEEILSSETDLSQIKTLTDMELETHRRIREHVAPELMSFLLPRVVSEEVPEVHPARQYCRSVMTTLGRILLSSRQASALLVKKHAQFSGLVEQFAAVVCAKVSFAQAEMDLALLCGIHISDSTLQRLVQRIDIPKTQPISYPRSRTARRARRERDVEYRTSYGLPGPRKRGRKPDRYQRIEKQARPQLPEELEANQGRIHHLSVDGGKIRLASPDSESGTQWRDYKGLAINGGLPSQEMHACLHDNEALAARVRGRPGLATATFIADGHAGVWNAMNLMRPPWPDGQAGASSKESAHSDEASAGIEILDWYHLKENVHKTSWKSARKARACDLLWEGKVSEALVKEVRDPNCKLWKYLDSHRDRIVNYKQRQEAGLVIGSGAVESTVKQVDARMQLPGAWWNAQNVNPMLNLRTAYLNGWLHAWP